jgi:hypothetical protein
MAEPTFCTVPILRIFGLEIAPWNARVMEVTDPFGNRLRFNEDLPPRAG